MNILIVGGGFGGVKTALELAKSHNYTITLVSNSPYFQYYPALYSTATGNSYKESWVSLKTIFRYYPEVNIIEETLARVDDTRHTAIMASGKELHYDKLVLGLGSITTFFGIEGLDSYAFGIKSEAEIRKLQQHLVEDMSDGREDETHYIIIGAGPTGVELAGALGQYIKTLRKHFKIRKKKMNLTLIEASPRVLPRLSEKASKLAHARLEKLGVKIELNRKIEKQTADSIIVNGRSLKTQTVIWTSGVANVGFYKQNEAVFTLNERGKVIVDEYMQAAKDIYVIGDNAATPYAGLAQTALHDAIFVAGHIQGKQKKYKVVLPPSVIPIGENWAVFEWRKLRFAGRPGAWIREAADIIGYHDILPIGYALGVWRAGKKPQMLLPEKLEL